MLPAPEIAERLVVPTFASRGVQTPGTLVRESSMVFLTNCLRLLKGVPLPTPAAPPRVVPASLPDPFCLVMGP